MQRTWAIAINTFREAVRDKVLHGVLGFACAILVFTLALAELSLHQQRRVVLDVGLASISFFSVVIAVFLGSSLLYKEIERKTLYVILPKPIRRHELLLGKYVGIVVTAAVFIGIMGAVQLWLTAVHAGASIALLATRLKSEGPIVRALAATGQRSMTCYLMQSVVWTVVFTPFLLDLAGTLSVWGVALLATGTWLTTVLIADLMRSRGVRGPFETLVRLITYRGLR